MVTHAENPVLKGVSLAAIVRDEIVNPAGGIVDLVESTVPFVEEAIIVDTGSVDGTREALDDLERKHPNLRIYDRAFDGYASSRNHSLSLVETEGILILDADERLMQEDFVKVDEELKGYLVTGS